MSQHTLAVVLPLGVLHDAGIPPRGIVVVWLPDTAPTRGYTATKDQLHKRLRRIEGQVRGIERMVDDDRLLHRTSSCRSPRSQAALDKVALGLLDGHVKHCVANADESEREAQTAGLMEAMARFMRR